MKSADRVVFRHMIVFDQWSVHGGTRMRFMVHRPELLAWYAEMGVDIALSDEPQDRFAESAAETAAA